MPRLPERRGGLSGASPRARIESAQRGHVRTPQPRSVDDLTQRELEILGLMADGLFNREISERLWLAEETVKTHVHHVLRKLGARSRAHAVAIALRGGLID